MEKEILENYIGKTIYYKGVGGIILVVNIKAFEKAGDKYVSDSYTGSVFYLVPNNRDLHIQNSIEWACEKCAFERNVKKGKYNHLIDQDTLRILTELQFERGGWLSAKDINEIKNILKISGEEDPRILMYLRNMIVSFFADQLKESPMNNKELRNSLSAITSVLDTTLEHF
ncbi:MAG: hypothetical protein ACRC26_12050 [Bacteroidales bacterium]